MWGEQNNLVTEFMTIAIGFIIALIFHLDIFACIAFALCLASVIMTVATWILTLSFYLRTKN